MNDRELSWRQIANLLADRLQYQAHQCPHHDFDMWAEHADTCAFCADTQAYEIWKRRKQ